MKTDISCGAVVLRRRTCLQSPPLRRLVRTRAPRADVPDGRAADDRPSSSGSVPAAAAGVHEVLLQGRASFSLKPRARSRRECGKGSCGGCGRQGRHGDDPSSRKHENSSQGLFSNPAADAAQCSALRSSPRSPALSSSRESNPWFTSLSSSASSSWRDPSSDSSSSS